MGIERFVSKHRRKLILEGRAPRWLLNHGRMEYIAAVCVSAPPWVDKKALYALRDEARRLTRETGILHVMAHIVPLTHPKVCGLTVPWNIEVKPWRSNLSEGNGWSAEELEQLQFELDHDKCMGHPGRLEFVERSRAQWPQTQNQNSRSFGRNNTGHVKVAEEMECRQKKLEI